MEVGQKVASKVYRKQLARKGKMAKGGSVDDMYVAVGEKDGYWTILSKPSSKEKSQKLLDLTTLPKGEVGKVVSVEDARSHKLVIGREYLKYAKGGEIAESNRNMALNKAKELCHHVDELHNVLKGKKHIEAWVIAKLERASSDLSDVTHYLDGLSEQKTH